MATLVVGDLRKTYGNGEVALDGVGLTVEESEFVAVIGLSGSGKSTLLRCINRLVEPDSGSVVLNGVEVTRLGMQQLRRARRDMAMIFQEFNLVDRLTVLENVLSGRLASTSTWRSMLRAFSQADIDLALDICERVGILDHIEKRADQLSGGQRQRVGVARAIIQGPQVLLIDEPTSSLDPKIGGEVMDLIWRVSKEEKIPVLISLHDIQFAMRYADRVMGLQRGVKVIDSRPSELTEAAIHDVYTVRT